MMQISLIRDNSGYVRYGRQSGLNFVVRRTSDDGPTCAIIIPATHALHGAIVGGSVPRIGWIRAWCGGMLQLYGIHAHSEWCIAVTLEWTNRNARDFAVPCRELCSMISRYTEGPLQWGGAAYVCRLGLDGNIIEE